MSKDEGEVAADKTITSDEVDEAAPRTERRSLIAGRYSVEALVGTGGMGAVYRARDLELDEIVALKMLNRGFDSSAEAVQRFRREVKLARRVTHKNVARTFDIGEHEGDRFLTMELVEGVSLSAVRGEDPLPVARATAITLDICAGLGAAHAAGVVHRDLKPDNILVANDGRVVITDFGIACAVAAPNEEHGRLIGTPAFMAPEQIEGDAEVDARADIYALGAILYELVTGERAWRGANFYKVIAAKLVSVPPDPRDKRRDLPDSVAAIITKCMARSRDARYRDIASIAQALMAAVPDAATTSGAPDARFPPVATRALRKIIAVLPFHSDSPADAHVAHALTEDLTDLLSQSPDLRVRARGTVAPTAADRDACSLGRAMGVDVLVEGSVRRAGDVVRVSLRLLSVLDGFQLWSQRFAVPLSQAFSIADEAARAVCDAVTLAWSVAPRVQSADSETIELYMRARFAYHDVSKAGLERALGLFRTAVAHAPSDARIVAGHAMALSRQLFYDSSHAAVEAALDAARAAIELAPDRGEPRAALASVLLGVGQSAAAAIEAESALRVAPENADALLIAGRLVSECGRIDEGIAMMERSLEIEPNFAIVFEVDRLAALAGDWTRAEETFSRKPDARTENICWLIRWRLLLWSRDAARARALLPIVRASSFQMRDTAELVLSLVAEQSAHAPVVAAFAVDTTPTRATRFRAIRAQMLAEVCAFAGDASGVFGALEEANRAELLDIGWLERCPLFAAYADDPRFAAIRATVANRAALVSSAITRRAPT